MTDSNQDINGPKLAEELRSVLAKNIEANLQLLTRVSGMVREVARTFGDNPTQSRPPGEIVNRMVQLNLSYFALLTKHGLAFADELAGITERALGIKPGSGSSPSAEASAPTPGTPPSAAPRIEINLNAHVGEVAVASFLVENNQPQTLNVSFEASQIISRNREPIRSATVRFDPPRLAIKPSAQATVRALVDISPEFKVGEFYLLRVRLVGFEQKEVWIAIHILPPAAKAGTKTRISKKRKRSAKPR